MGTWQEFTSLTGEGAYEGLSASLFGTSGFSGPLQGAIAHLHVRQQISFHEALQARNRGERRNSAALDPRPGRDSHVDSHGGTTRCDAMDRVDGSHERSGRQPPPNDAMHAEHADF